jgi:hypothetical protein
VTNRTLGAAVFAVSGIAFLVAVAYLYSAEGPGSPDILDTLSSPGGRGLLNGFVAGGVVAVILYVMGAALLYVQLRPANELGMLIVLLLAAVTAPVVIGFLAFQYTQVVVAQEGISTHDPAFRVLVVSAHSFADVGGWATIAMLAFSVFLVSLVLRQAARWRVMSIGGFAISALAIPLFALDSSYIFLIPFALWEVGIAASFGLAPPIAAG